MKARSRSARIAAQLADLKMPGALEALDEVLAAVGQRRNHRGRGHQVSSFRRVSHVTP